MFTQLAKAPSYPQQRTHLHQSKSCHCHEHHQAFAQARLLDINLARNLGLYVEPENLLTITVPTGLPKKPIYKGEHAGTYLSYHQKSWESVAKISLKT